MKDFIYVDNDLATSYHSQLNRGAIIKSSASTQNSNQSTVNSGKETTNKGTAKITLGIDAGWDRQISSTDSTAELVAANKAQATEIVLHDYLIDSLITDLIADNKVKTSSSNFKEGDFVLYKETFTILDLHTAEQNLNPSVFESIAKLDNDEKEQLSILKKITPKTHELNVEIANLQGQINEKEQTTNHTLKTIKNMQEIISKLSILFPNTVLMKAGHSVALCDVDKFRLSPSAMLPINLSTRPITIFGSVISQSRTNDVDMSGETFDMLSKSSIFMPEIVLRELQIKKDGDYNIRPIAIYFESDGVAVQP